MSKSNTLETQLLTKLFTDQAFTTLGSISLGSNLYIALYRSDPTDANIGLEANYTGYARAAVARTSSAFTVSSNQVVNTNAVIFNQCTAGTNTITHFAVFSALTVGTMLYHGAVTTPLSVVTDVIPAFQAGTLTITED
jgi:hypothetical protein